MLFSSSMIRGRFSRGERKRRHGRRGSGSGSGGGGSSAGVRDDRGPSSSSRNSRTSRRRGGRDDDGDAPLLGGVGGGRSKRRTMASERREEASPAPSTELREEARPPAPSAERLRRNPGTERGGRGAASTELREGPPAAAALRHDAGGRSGGAERGRVECPRRDDVRNGENEDVEDDDSFDAPLLGRCGGGRDGATSRYSTRARTAEEAEDPNYYSPRRSERVRGPSASQTSQGGGGGGDGDTWVEIIVVSHGKRGRTRKGRRNSCIGGRERVRSLFYSCNTRKAVWDEPPTGASKIVLWEDMERDGVEAMTSAMAECGMRHVRYDDC